MGSNPIRVAKSIFTKLVFYKDASVAQSVEQGTENPCVGGSIPPGGTIKLFLSEEKAGLREWLSGRASPCQGERREFESRLPLHLLQDKRRKNMRLLLFVSGAIAKW